MIITVNHLVEAQVDWEDVDAFLLVFGKDGEDIDVIVRDFSDVFDFAEWGRKLISDDDELGKFEEAVARIRAICKGKVQSTKDGDLRASAIREADREIAEAFLISYKELK